MEIDKKHLRKTLRNHFIQTILIYLIIYSYSAFANWELFNPFQWIIDMPTHGTVIRSFIFLIVIIYNVLGIMMRYDISKEKTKS